jgi:hypothetical protein
MGAGASAIPDKVSLEDARAFAGDKFDLEVFKTNCDEDGFINRDVLLQYDKKEIVHARTMPSSLTAKILQGDLLHQIWDIILFVQQPKALVLCCIIVVLPALFQNTSDGKQLTQAESMRQLWRKGKRFLINAFLIDFFC